MASTVEEAASVVVPQFQFMHLSLNLRQLFNVAAGCEQNPVVGPGQSHLGTEVVYKLKYRRVLPIHSAFHKYT